MESPAAAFFIVRFRPLGVSYDRDWRKSGTRRRARHGRRGVQFDTMSASSMTVVQLRKALEERGLDTKGLKAALVQRYQKALDNDAKNSRPPTRATTRTSPRRTTRSTSATPSPIRPPRWTMMRFPSAATTRTTLATHPSTPPPSSRLRRACLTRIAPDVWRMAPATAIAARAASAVPRVRRPRVSSSPIARTQRVPPPRTARSCSAPSAATRPPLQGLPPAHPRLRDSQGRVPHLRRCVAQDVLVPAAQDRSRPRVPHLQEEGARAPQLPG